MAKAIMKFKSLHGSIREGLSSKFTFRNDTTLYRLRSSEMKLALPHPRTGHVSKRLSYGVALLWNSLPTGISVSKT